MLLTWLFWKVLPHHILKSFLSFPIKQNAIKNISVDRNQIIIDSDIDLKTFESSQLLANWMYYAFNWTYSILIILTILATFSNNFLESISLMTWKLFNLKKMKLQKDFNLQFTSLGNEKSIHFHQTNTHGILVVYLVTLSRIWTPDTNTNSKPELYDLSLSA